MRVRGTYLGQPFAGMVIGVKLLADMKSYEVIVNFDEPVDVSRSELFSAFRRRVTSTLDVHGVSLARTGDGQPQMRLQRA
jgi:hypothetical protein